MVPEFLQLVCTIYPKMPLLRDCKASFMEKNWLFFGPAYFYPLNSISIASKLGKTRQKILFWTTCFPRPFQKTFSFELIFVSATEFNIFVLFFVTIFCSVLSFFTNFVKWEVMLEDRLGPIPLPHLILYQS